MFGLGEGVQSGFGIPAGGIENFQDWGDFAKAVQTSSNQTDHANLTGMAALRIESLEPTLRAVVAQDDSLTFFRSLKRQPVTSTVHEWMVQTSRGGQFDGFFNSELGDINQDVGDYKRQVMVMKYLMTGAAISHVASVQSLHGATLRARENENAMVRLAVGVNRALYHADSRVSPNALDGIEAQLDQFDGGSHVRDLEGLDDANELVKELMKFKVSVRQEGIYGDITDLYTDNYVQNELDQSLFPQYRIALADQPSNLMIGAPVAGIKTAFGNIRVNNDIWMNNNANSAPAIAKNRKLPDGAPGKGVLTATKIAAGDVKAAGSTFTAERAGTYYFTAVPVNSNGVQGDIADPVSVTLGAGDAAELSFQPATDAKETGVQFYRSKRDPKTVPVAKDFRLMTAVPAVSYKTNSSDPTVYVDVNQNIPGASTIVLVNKKPDSIQWAQLLPATQFPLYPTKSAVIPWAVLLYGALQLGIPQHHYVLKNFVPKNADWHPFN